MFVQLLYGRNKRQKTRAPPGCPWVRSAASGPGGRWGSVVLGWRALRPPRVVFVIAVASLINLSLQAKVNRYTRHG